MSKYIHGLETFLARENLGKRIRLEMTRFELNNRDLGMELSSELGQIRWQSAAQYISAIRNGKSIDHENERRYREFSAKETIVVYFLLNRLNIKPDDQVINEVEMSIPGFRDEYLEYLARREQGVNPSISI